MKPNKLLIIPCSNAKCSGGEVSNRLNYFGDDNISGQFNQFLNDRNRQALAYNSLLRNEREYFSTNRKGIPLDSEYFIANSKILLGALDRYTGAFYKEDLKNLYLNAIYNSNLHILIVSGLFGVIRWDDTIPDYRLEIAKIPLWTVANNRSINEAVLEYMRLNEIEDSSVFYSLPNSGGHSYCDALKPKDEWRNLWVVKGGLGSLHASANGVKNFLVNL